MEILDVAYYCLALSNKKKADIKEQQVFIYNLSKSISAFIAPLLSNKVKAPTFEQLFPQNETLNNNSKYVKTDNDIYNHLKQKIERRNNKLGRTKKPDS